MTVIENEKNRKLSLVLPLTIGVPAGRWDGNPSPKSSSRSFSMATAMYMGEALTASSAPDFSDTFPGFQVDDSEHASWVDIVKCGADGHDGRRKEWCFAERDTKIWYH